MSIEENQTLTTVDGSRLFFRCIKPAAPSDVKGVVFAAHGFAEHSGRYVHLAHRLAKEYGLAFATFDMRGHGHSGPVRGDAPHLLALITDTFQVFGVIKNLFSSSLSPAHATPPPIFLMGHSFGGYLMTLFSALLQKESPPLFLSSPCYQLAKKVPFLTYFVVKKLPESIYFPLIVNLNTISESPTNKINYKKDPLILKKISIRLGRILLNALQKNIVNSHAKLISSPVAMFYGEKEKLVDKQRIQEVFKLISSSDKELFKFSQSGHEILFENETDGEDAFHTMAKWFLKYLK